MAELLMADPSADRDRWLELRRTGVTATDIAVILGLVSWDSPFALYHRKKGTLPGVEASDRMRLGSWLESSIMAEWRNRTQPVGELRSAALFANRERLWQLATPDALVMAYGKRQAVLECKSSATRDGWGHLCTCDPGPEGQHAAHCDPSGVVPPHVRAQVLWQMDVLDVATGHVAVVFLPSGEFRSYTIDHDQDMYPHVDDRSEPTCRVCGDQWAMRAAGLEFYRRLQGELPPPPLDHLPATTAALKHLQAELTLGKRTEILPARIDDYRTACDAYDRAKTRKSEMSNRLRALMGDAQYAVDELGQPIARREVFKRTARKTVQAGEVLGEVDRLVPVRPKGDNGEN